MLLMAAGPSQCLVVKIARLWYINLVDNLGQYNFKVGSTASAKSRNFAHE